MGKACKQITLDEEAEPKNIIKDSECDAGSPVIYGYPKKPVYGLAHPIRPRSPGKNITAYDKRIYLPELLPLEEYDLVVVLFSGGRDSVASYLTIKELGVPKEKIELWHHEVDGRNRNRSIDWPVTTSYVRAFAEAEGVRLRLSWRVDGFFGELYRVGSSHPIVYSGDNGLVVCPLSPEQEDCREIRTRPQISDAEWETLKSYGYRMKFPAKSGDLSRRWCSAYLKIGVASTVIRNLEQTSSNAKILVVSGERRGESAGRSRYNEMELHSTHAPTKKKRIVHQWRAVIDYTLRDIWEVCKRHKLTPHPCYSCGWNRCSCMCCIFSLPSHWAGIRELFPYRFARLLEDEKALGFTLNDKMTLDVYIGTAKSCVSRSNPKALRQLTTGCFHSSDMHMPNWEFPVGAFKGSGGGAC